MCSHLKAAAWAQGCGPGGGSLLEGDPHEARGARGKTRRTEAALLDQSGVAAPQSGPASVHRRPALRPDLVPASALGTPDQGPGFPLVALVQKETHDNTSRAPALGFLEKPHFSRGC